jgi:hypothetical protein
VSRIEHGLVRALDPEELSVMYAVVGLELSVRAYPAGNPLRDAGHVALLGRLRARLHAGVRWRSEVPMPILGDLRAWDAMLTVERRDIGVEAETRPTDLQALERRIALKLRDSGLDHAILLLADTRHNRALVRAHADALHERFPLPGKACLERLAAGTFPGGSAIVLL